MDPRDMAAYMADILRGQSHAELIGPIADAGGENGIVLRAEYPQRESNSRYEIENLAC